MNTEKGHPSRHCVRTPRLSHTGPQNVIVIPVLSANLVTTNFQFKILWRHAWKLMACGWWICLCVHGIRYCVCSTNVGTVLQNDHVLCNVCRHCHVCVCVCVCVILWYSGVRVGQQCAYVVCSSHAAVTRRHERLPWHLERSRPSCRSRHHHGSDQ